MYVSFDDPINDLINYIIDVLNLLLKPLLSIIKESDQSMYWIG